MFAAIPSPSQAEADLRLLQLHAWEQIGKLHDDFVAARRLLNKPLCVDVNKDRVSVSLSISSRLASTEKADLQRRKPGDKVVSFEAEPVSTVVFEVVPGALVTSLVSGARTFVVENGVVVGRPAGTAFHIGGFAMGRWPKTPVWGALGVATSDTKNPDLFAGLVVRLGNLITGPNLGIGGGVSWTYAPVGLKKGAEGQPLPSGVDKLDDIVDRSYQPGLGVVFTLTGLKLSK
jgi:hypothetical protein